MEMRRNITSLKAPDLLLRDPALHSIGEANCCHSRKAEVAADSNKIAL